MMSKMSKKLKVLRLSTLLFAGLASQSAFAITGTITIGVAANFTTTLTTITQNFINAQKALGNTYTIKLVSDSSGNLLNTITAKNGVNSYDLFLSADKTRPDTLATKPALAIASSEWLYAVGELEFWSPIKNDASVVNGIRYPLTQNFSIANPATAPYGTAAATVLNTVSGGGIPWPVTGTYPNPPNAFVNVKANITLTKSAITATGAIKQGFIAQSSICTQSGTTKSFTKGGGTHHTYAFNVAPTHPKIAQYGIQLVNSARTGGSVTLLNDFYTYLKTNTAALNVIKGNCYALN